MDIILLLILFQVKHWYADFAIQTYMQTVKKGIWLDPVGMSHSFDHVWCSFVALVIFYFIHTIPLYTLVLIPAVEGVLHYLIDYVKVRYGCKDNTKPLFWNQFGQDQLAHQLTYLAIVYFLLLK